MFLRRERLADGVSAELQLRVTSDVLSTWDGYRGLVRWASSFEGVESVRHDAEHDTLVIRYDERRTAGELLRGARCSTACSRRSLPVSVGDARLGRPLAARPAAACACTADRSVSSSSSRRIEGLDGVEASARSRAIQSIVVFFDAAAISEAQIVVRAEAVPQVDLPAPPPTPPSPQLEWLKTGVQHGGADRRDLPASCRRRSCSARSRSRRCRRFAARSRAWRSARSTSTSWTRPRSRWCFAIGEADHRGHHHRAARARRDLILERTQARAPRDLRADAPRRRRRVRHRRHDGAARVSARARAGHAHRQCAGRARARRRRHRRRQPRA